MTDRPWRAAPGGLGLAVRVTPRAARDGVDGPGRDAAGRPALAVRVRAAPEGGRANAAVCAAVARAAGLPKSAVTVTHGAGARDKRLHLAGDAGASAARLESLWHGESD